MKPEDEKPRTARSRPLSPEEIQRILKQRWREDPELRRIEADARRRFPLPAYACGVLGAETIYDLPLDLSVHEDARSGTIYLLYDEGFRTGNIPAGIAGEIIVPVRVETERE